MDWDADFAGLPPIELPDGRKLETLADLRGYILALPKQERLRWNDAVAVLPKAAEHGGPFRFYRTGGLLEDTAWNVGRWSDTEGAGQERGTEGEATRSETLRNVSYGMQLIRVPSAHPDRARVFSRDLAPVHTGALCLLREYAVAQKPKPMLNGRELSKGELEVIRRHLESVDTISGISDEILALITQYWPDQLVKVKPPNTAN